MVKSDCLYCYLVKSIILVIKIINYNIMLIRHDIVKIIIITKCILYTFYMHYLV